MTTGGVFTKKHPSSEGRIFIFPGGKEGYENPRMYVLFQVWKQKESNPARGGNSVHGGKVPEKKWRGCGPQQERVGCGGWGLGGWWGCILGHFGLSGCGVTCQSGTEVVVNRIQAGGGEINTWKNDKKKKETGRRPQKQNKKCVRGDRKSEEF